MNVIKDRYKNNRMVTKAEKSKKTRQKNSQNRGQKNRSQDRFPIRPVKSAVSANKGSDLLLFASNKPTVASARPQLLHDGQIVYLWGQRRRA